MNHIKLRFCSTPCWKATLFLVSVLTIIFCQFFTRVQPLPNHLAQEEQDVERSEVNPNNQNQGSWSSWWSYEGVSGPDYWNINKQWRICASGRKQSPIDIKTSRLVYDHLLQPIHLHWLHTASSALPSADQSGPLNNYPNGAQTATTTATTTAASTIGADTPGNQVDELTREGPVDEKEEEEAQTMRLTLVNTGRGLEAWAAHERVGVAAAAPAHHPSQAQLSLSGGPLSYEYRFFKIELHSSAPTTGGPSLSTTGPRTSTHPSGVEGGPPEHLRQGKTSEHLIDGRPFDAEIQLHFYNRQLASSAAEALRLSDERPIGSLFAVVSVFAIGHSPELSPSTSANNHSSLGRHQQSGHKQRPAMGFLLDNLDSLQNQGSSLAVRVSRRQIMELITDRRHYVTYEGSLNRPPCSETVDWILLNKPVPLDLAKLGQLFDKLQNTNQENVRPINGLFNRQLRTSIAFDGSASRPAEQKQPAAFKENCSKLNCTGALSIGMDGLNQPREPTSSRGHCSMKPNYAYQFTFDLHNERKQFLNR